MREKLMYALSLLSLMLCVTFFFACGPTQDGQGEENIATTEQEFSSWTNWDEVQVPSNSFGYTTAVRIGYVNNSVRPAMVYLIGVNQHNNKLYYSKLHQDALTPYNLSVIGTMYERQVQGSPDLLPGSSPSANDNGVYYHPTLGAFLAYTIWAVRSDNTVVYTYLLWSQGSMYGGWSGEWETVPELGDCVNVSVAQEVMPLVVCEGTDGNYRYVNASDWTYGDYTWQGPYMLGNPPNTNNSKASLVMRLFFDPSYDPTGSHFVWDVFVRSGSHYYTKRHKRWHGPCFHGIDLIDGGPHCWSNWTPVPRPATFGDMSEEITVVVTKDDVPTEYHDICQYMLWHPRSIFGGYMGRKETYYRCSINETDTYTPWTSLGTHHTTWTVPGNSLFGNNVPAVRTDGSLDCIGGPNLCGHYVFETVYNPNHDSFYYNSRIGAW